MTLLEHDMASYCLRATLKSTMETSIVTVENYNEMKIFSSKQHGDGAESLSDAEELFEMSEEQRGKFDSCLL